MQLLPAGTLLGIPLAVETKVAPIEATVNDALFQHAAKMTPLCRDRVVNPNRKPLAHGAPEAPVRSFMKNVALLTRFFRNICPSLWHIGACTMAWEKPDNSLRRCLKGGALYQLPTNALKQET